MMPFEQPSLRHTRRMFLSGVSGGLGYIALSILFNRNSFATSSGSGKTGDRRDGVNTSPHHPPRAKRVIFLYMAGGPSHLETFDPKPMLTRMHGKALPPSVVQGQVISPNDRSANLCVQPLFPFRRCGQSGLSICALFPHLAEIVDDLCVIRSMRTVSFVHD